MSSLIQSKYTYHKYHSLWDKIFAELPLYMNPRQLNRIYSAYYGAGVLHYVVAFHQMQHIVIKRPLLST